MLILIVSEYICIILGVLLSYPIVPIRHVNFGPVANEPAGDILIPSSRGKHQGGAPFIVPVVQVNLRHIQSFEEDVDDIELLLLINVIFIASLVKGMISRWILHVQQLIALLFLFFSFEEFLTDPARMYE